MTQRFYLDGHEHIALCDLLKFCGLAESGGQAKTWIAQGRVSRNGSVETRKTAKIRAGETVCLDEHCIEVHAGAGND
nr:RNA-binding S4 domain-containing protein [Neisseria sp. HSC-16F19]